MPARRSIEVEPQPKLGGSPVVGCRGIGGPTGQDSAFVGGQERYVPRAARSLLETFEPVRKAKKKKRCATLIGGLGFLCAYGHLFDRSRASRHQRAGAKSHIVVSPTDQASGTPLATSPLSLRARLAAVRLVLSEAAAVRSKADF
jgi:hypothetical protein